MLNIFSGADWPIILVIYIILCELSVNLLPIIAFKIMSYENSVYSEHKSFIRQWILAICGLTFSLI